MYTGRPEDLRRLSGLTRTAAGSPGLNAFLARLELSTKNRWVPTFFTISPTMRCNLKCRGCYAGLYTKDGELREAEIDRILQEARDLGI